MISLNCDRCEQKLEVKDSQAGTKLECPHCGDTNIVPEIASASARTASAGASDKASAMGLPPDSGPEQRVLLVRPAMVRARPLVFFGLAVLAGGGLAGIVYFGLVETQKVAAWLSASAMGAATIALVIWKIRTLGVGLEITNKRTIERRGLLSRATNEVVHDNIRNLQITQSFWNRVWGVGKIGISSSGQDGIEILVKSMPKPQQLRKTIDAYRPL